MAILETIITVVATALIKAGVSWGVAQVVSYVVSYALIYGALSALSYAANSLLAKKPDSPNNNNGHLVNTQAQTEPIKIIYGKVRVGCNRVYAHTAGSRNKYLTLALVVGEGPIEGLEYDSYGDIIYLDESRSTQYEHWKGRDLFDHDFHEGTWDQTTDAMLCDATKGNTNFSERMKWVAYCATRLVSSSSAWAQLPNHTFVVKGRKLFDPRTGMVSYYQTTRIKTQANAGATNIDVTSTTGMATQAFIRIRLDNGAFHETTIQSVVDSDTVQIAVGIPAGRYAPVNYKVEFNGPNNPGQNPALVWYDHMRNRRYSRGIPFALVNTDSVIAGANTCDSKGWQFNGVIMDRKPFIDNLADIEESFLGGHLWTAGQYYLKMLAYDTPVMTLTENETAANPDKFKFQEGGIPEIPDRLTVFFCDPTDNYVSKPLPLMISGIVSEGIQDNPQEMALVGVTSYQQAFDVGAYHLKRMRASKTFTIPCHPRTIMLDPFDMVQMTHSFPGWTNKVLRVKNLGIPQQGLIPITFMEESADLYTGSGITVATHYAYQSTLPNPNQTLEEPTGITAETGADESTENKLDAYIKFSCDNVGAGYDYEWQWKQSGKYKRNKIKVADPNTEVPDATFTGTGTLEMSTEGEFTAEATINYRVQIDGAGSPNTFKWSDDGGSTWDATGVAITGGIQALNNGVSVQFSGTTGGVVGDRWDFSCVEEPKVTFTVSGVKCNTTFFYRVRTESGKQKSDWAYGATPITTWTPSLPTMSGYSPTVTAIKQGKQLLVDWSDWSGFGASNVKDYEVYCSTEGTCTITDANRVTKGVRGSNYTIKGVSRGVTYDVRVRPMGFTGAGTASS